MEGRVLKLILFIELHNLVISLPDNTLREKLILSRNYDKKIKLKNSSLRQAESEQETDPNIIPSDLSGAKETENESNGVKELNKPSVSDTIDVHDKRDPTQDIQSNSDEAENIQGSLSISENNENEHSNVNVDNNNVSEDGFDEDDIVDDEKYNEDNGEPLNLDSNNYIDTQNVPEKNVQTDDSNLDELKTDAGKQERSLLAGDIFTPSEMLPITIKLIAKVDNPGSGKGIVSSSKNPRELADRLFEAFFLTHKRIVTLKDFDISGLDALQALALSGEPADLRTVSHSGLKSTLGDQYKMAPRKSHYRLVTKKIKIGHRNRGNNRRDLANRLAKKRRLVLKSNRRLEHRSTKELNKPTRTKSKKNAKELNIENFDRTKQRTIEASITTKPLCRWRYECTNIADIDTCRLHTLCAKGENGNKKFIPVKHREDEHSVPMEKFRKMLGITFVDEEVEKILENRFVHLRLSNLEGIERIESLSEYFNKIIMTEYLESTTSSWAPKKQ